MDIVCFTETKLDNFDDVEFCGYTCFTKNRRNFKNRSGGLCILVRDELLDYVHVIESHSLMKTVEGKLLKYFRFVELPLSENALFFLISIPNGTAFTTIVLLCTYHQKILLM
jgi:hypothetical protein